MSPCLVVNLDFQYISFLSLLFLSPFSYMVMPLVAQDLGHIMKKRRLTDRIITYLFYQLLRGLKASVYLLMYLIVEHTFTVNTSAVRPVAG